MDNLGLLLGKYKEDERVKAAVEILHSERFTNLHLRELVGAQESFAFSGIYQAKPTTRTGREASNREARMEFLRDLATEHGVLHYDYDTLEAMLKEAGLPTGRGTVYNYVRECNLQTVVVRKGRKDGQAQLPS